MGKQYYIASVSWGKDSLAMLFELVNRSMPLDEVIFYDTGMEFEAIYSMRDKALPLLKIWGIRYTELKPMHEFTYKMLNKPVQERNGGTHNGYSWCGGRCRWGTTDKLQALDKYAKSKRAKVYVGIAADELHRLDCERKPYKLFPLVKWGFTEAQCLQICYDRCFDWRESTEDGYICLYDILDRVSCWCCANKNLKELKNIYIHLPTYWEQLKDLQNHTGRPMKGYYKGEPRGVFELEKRFKAELTAGGKPINGRICFKNADYLNQRN